MMVARLFVLYEACKLPRQRCSGLTREPRQRCHFRFAGRRGGVLGFGPTILLNAPKHCFRGAPRDAFRAHGQLCVARPHQVALPPLEVVQLLPWHSRDVKLLRDHS